MSVSETAAAMATSYTPEGYGAIRGGCQQSAADPTPGMAIWGWMTPVELRWLGEQAARMRSVVEDAAFRYACDALVAPTRRLPGDAVHLFHPRLPISIPGGPGYVEQFAIVAEYRDAAEEGPEAVRALVENRGS